MPLDALGKEGDMSLESAGLTVIDRGGIDPDGFDLPFTHEPGRRLGMQPWEMEHSNTFRPSQLCA